METMVNIQNLSKHFGSLTAVNDISFNVKKGEVLGFLGPNGAGKSTTMKMITGFLNCDGGTIEVGGNNLETDPIAVKRCIGYLPEGAPAYQDMKPREFLEFIAQIRGFTGNEIKSRVDQVIEKVNLQSVLNQSIDTLSKGFKRRVGLAQAILHDPQVLILDEPTDGLDPNQKQEVRNLIKAMAPEKAIILSTHILEEVDAVCTRATIIASGKIVADGTPNDLECQSPYHNSVTLTLNQVSEEDAKSGLNSLGVVENIELINTENQFSTFRIFPKEKQSIVAKVSKLAQEKNWEIDELHVEKGRLDDVFRSITLETQSIT